MQKKPFFNTMLGSWVKVFLAAVVIQMMNNLQMGMTIVSWNRDTFWDFITAGAAAVLPVIFNFLNRQDPRYGLTKKEKIDG